MNSKMVKDDLESSVKILCQEVKLMQVENQNRIQGLSQLEEELMMKTQMNLMMKIILVTFERILSRWKKLPEIHLNKVCPLSVTCVTTCVKMWSPCPSIRTKSTNNSTLRNVHLWNTMINRNIKCK